MSSRRKRNRGNKVKTLEYFSIMQCSTHYRWFTYLQQERFHTRLLFFLNKTTWNNLEVKYGLLLQQSLKTVRKQSEEIEVRELWLEEYLKDSKGELRLSLNGYNFRPEDVKGTNRRCYKCFSEYEIISSSSEVYLYQCSQTVEFNTEPNGGKTKTLIEIEIKYRDYYQVKFIITLENWQYFYTEKSVPFLFDDKNGDQHDLNSLFSHLFLDLGLSQVNFKQVIGLLDILFFELVQFSIEGPSLRFNERSILELLVEHPSIEFQEDIVEPLIELWIPVKRIGIYVGSFVRTLQSTVC